MTATSGSPRACLACSPPILAQPPSKVSIPPCSPSSALPGIDRPLGLVAQARYDADEWPELTPRQQVEFETLREFSSVRPDFLSWHVGDLPHATPELCRSGIGMPVMTWTVRSEEDRMRAAIWADQMIFEGFEP